MAGLVWGSGHWGVDSWAGTAGYPLAANGAMISNGSVTLGSASATTYPISGIAAGSPSSGSAALTLVPGAPLSLLANGAASSAGSGVFLSLTLTGRGAAASNGLGDLANLSGGDTTPPSIPTSLVALALGASEILLNWSASTDNVAVKGYTVYRNGSLLDTVDRPRYLDYGVLPSRAYSYTVDAFDTSNNHSSQSAIASATTAAYATNASGWPRLARISVPYEP